LDIVRTKSQLETLFADNNVGAISAQNGRDLIVSAFGFLANHSPGLNDDAYDSGGSGGFFDSGSRWTNLLTARAWFCIQGIIPNAATWQAMCYDGQPVTGGVVLGSLPGPLSLAPTGVIAGQYGDTSHYAVVQVGLDGRIGGAAQLPLPAGGGTVTSVGLSMPLGWGVAGSPVTSHGTIVVTSPLTTKGDLMCFAGHDDRFPVGLFGQVLTPNPLTPSGLDWGYVGTPGRPGGNPSGGQYMFDANGPVGARCWYVAGTAYASNNLAAGGPGMSEDGLLFAVPFQSPGGRIDKLAVYVLNGDGGGVAYHMRLGIYAAGRQTAPYPQNLIVDLGEIVIPDNAANTLFETPGGGGLITTPGQLYWAVGFGSFFGTPHGLSLATLFETPSALNVLGFVGDGANWIVDRPGIGWRIQSVYGPLPDPFPGDPSTAIPLTIQDDTAPAIGIHFQS
jgi:hypothetical protein